MAVKLLVTKPSYVGVLLTLVHTLMVLHCLYRYLQLLYSDCLSSELKHIALLGSHGTKEARLKHTGQAKWPLTCRSRWCWAPGSASGPCGSALTNRRYLMRSPLYRYCSAIGQFSSTLVAPSSFHASALSCWMGACNANGASQAEAGMRVLRCAFRVDGSTRLNVV